MEIYLIDDNEIDLWIAETLILQEMNSAKIHKFDNVKNVLARLRSGELADIILLDLFMPVSSGYNFLEEYEKMDVSHSPVVIVTNSFNPTDYESVTLSDLVKAYFEKPLTKEKIRSLRNLIKC